MDPTQLRRREEALDRNDAVLERWPQRSGKEFVAEMKAVVNELLAVAQEADAAEGDERERSRNWRYVGNAYFDLADAKDLDLLRLADAAYKKSESLLAGIDDPIERMKLNYSYGHTLFHLSEAKDLALVREARRRYASALEIARQKMPAGIESAQSALNNAERVIALLTQAEGLNQEIASLQGQIEAADAKAPSASPPVPDDAELFGKLLDVYKQDVAAGKVSPTKQQALGDVLSQLGGIIQDRPASLDEMTTSRGRLGDLMSSMAHLVHDTSHGQSKLTKGSRADVVWTLFSELKLYLSRDLMRPHMGSEERFAGMELYKRCGHADTFIHQFGQDDDTIPSYEVDVLRQLSCEVRTFSVRNHLTAVSPVWPSSPVPQNPNAVFFSGGKALRKLLDEVCAAARLKRLGESTPKALASARWDQLRACHIAIFDFTGYMRSAADRPIPLASRGGIASVSYELGIALALGRPIMVCANEEQELPFNVDIEPIRLKNDHTDRARLLDALDETIYGLQRAADESSVSATWSHLRQALASTQNVVTQQSLKFIDAAVAADPVKFRRFIEPALGSAGPNSPQIAFPAWPGSYPSPKQPRCFHVTAFGPAWAKETMKMVASACKAAKPRAEYVRGDQVMDPDIMRSIWDHLCQASHIFVDLTGLNANVALELGIAHALGRNVLLVTQDASVAPHFPAIAKVRMHRYSLKGDPGPKPLLDALSMFLSPEVAARAAH